jgi:hypothetical protein
VKGNSRRKVFGELSRSGRQPVRWFVGTEQVAEDGRRSTEQAVLVNLKNLHHDGVVDHADPLGQGIDHIPVAPAQFLQVGDVGGGDRYFSPLARILMIDRSLVSVIGRDELLWQITRDHIISKINIYNSINKDR